MTVKAIGWRAHAALTASGGRADVIARLSTSVYAMAAGELIWVGPPGTPLHPRGVALSAPPVAGAEPSIDVIVASATPWRPPALAALRDGRDVARRLKEAIGSLGEPRGLARLALPRAGDDLVTSRARGHAHALAQAAATDDAAAFAVAAHSLLGLGPGLTPSGDDYVGGALFARCLVTATDPAAWKTAAARIVADAATLTHPISARLLEDLAGGEGWEPLHALALALVDANREDTVRAARDLTSLGHTSGWDMLAGFLIGLRGPAF
ncbi:MAG: DUF2877 domain-containing protein [Candidatus Rokubacteria bacterium]|nr:DUF2877 domain-containing protein [Candidatus Rokubacteria bacterium]